MNDTPRTEALATQLTAFMAAQEPFTADTITPAIEKVTAKLLLHAQELERSLSEAVTFQLQARTAETLDAERYRYLRNAAGMCEAGPSVCSGLSDLFEYHWGPEVDEVVDEAIADWKARGCPLPKEAA